jgi:hypothetical protein
MSEADVLLNDPGYRRRWLLSKALEGGIPLDKALQLAQAAEEFIMGAASRATAADWLSQLAATQPIEERKETVTGAGAFDGLSSIVTIDDVVRYLKDSGETIVPETGDKFLVNGCSTENVDGLLDRANRKRTRERLPRFALLQRPSTDKTVARDKSATAEKAIVKRPPSARERAEWARQAVVLPA